MTHYVLIYSVFDGGGSKCFVPSIFQASDEDEARSVVTKMRKSIRKHEVGYLFADYEGLFTIDGRKIILEADRES